MRKVFIYMLLCSAINCFAQKDSTHKKSNLLDTLTKLVSKLNPKEQQKIINSLSRDTSEAHFIRDSIKLITPKLIRTEARIDSRSSIYQGTHVNIYGYYIGITIKSKLSLGLGYYRINTDLPAKRVINGVNTSTSLVVNCGSINSELVYYNRRYISLGFPLEFAFGQYNLTNTFSDNNQLIDQRVKFLSFANFGLSGTFKPFKFIGLKLMAGYRKSIYPEEKIFEFNGVYSSLGLFVDIVDFSNNIRMYKLMKRYHKVSNPLSTYVDLFTD